MRKFFVSVGVFFSLIFALTAVHNVQAKEESSTSERKHKKARGHIKKFKKVHAKKKSHHHKPKVIKSLDKTFSRDK